MSPDRRQRLDTLGFVWDVPDAQWEEGIRSFEDYRNAHGDALVPATYRDPTSGYRLGQWVSVQRTTKDTMPPERRQRARRDWVCVEGALSGGDGFGCSLQGAQQENCNLAVVFV